MEALTNRHELVDLTHQLVREHESVLSAGLVIRCVTRCRDELVLVGVQEGLTTAVEAMARRRLRGRLMGLTAVGT